MSLGAFGAGLATGFGDQYSKVKEAERARENQNRQLASQAAENLSKRDDLSDEDRSSAVSGIFGNLTGSSAPKRGTKSKSAITANPDAAKAYQGMLSDPNTKPEDVPAVLRNFFKSHGLEDKDIETAMDHFNQHAQAHGLIDQGGKPTELGRQAPPQEQSPNVPQQIPGVIGTIDTPPQTGSRPTDPLPTIASSSTTEARPPQITPQTPLPDSDNYISANRGINTATRKAEAAKQTEVAGAGEQARYATALKRADEAQALNRFEQTTGRKPTDAEAALIALHHEGVPPQAFIPHTFGKPINGREITAPTDSQGQPIDKTGNRIYQAVRVGNGMEYQPMDAIPADKQIRITTIAGPNGMPIREAYNRRGDIVQFQDAQGKPIAAPAHYTAVTTTDPETGEQYTKFVNTYIPPAGAPGGAGRTVAAPGASTPASPMPTRQGAAPAGNTPAAPAPSAQAGSSSAPTFRNLSGPPKKGQTITADDGSKWNVISVDPKTGVQMVPVPATPASALPSSPAEQLGSRLYKTKPERLPTDVRTQLRVLDEQMPVVDKVVKLIQTEADKLSKSRGGELMDVGKAWLNLGEYKAGLEPSDPTRKKILRDVALLKVALAQPYLAGMSRSFNYVKQVQEHLPDPTDGLPLMLDKLQQLQTQLPQFRRITLEEGGMHVMGTRIIGDKNRSGAAE